MEAYKEAYPLTDDQITAMLEKAKAFRGDAMYFYTEALQLAAQYGWTNIRMAKTLGVTEAAVRNYRKRHRV